MSAITSDLSLFQIHEDQTIEDSWRKIELNKSGAVFVVNSQSAVTGCLTDGDIRRWLIANPGDTTAHVHRCMNKKFIWVSWTDKQENILKLLDTGVQILPILDSQKRLNRVVSRDSVLFQEQRSVYARAKAPVRVSFCGGGSDLTHYFSENGGFVLNATISLYAHSTLKKSGDNSVEIFSFDLKKRVVANSLAELLEKNEIPLLVSVLKLIRPDFGFKLEVGSDFPVGSGLGGSSVVLASIIGCFNQFREIPWDNYEMAELAFQAERLVLKVAGGWQDQYATVFGGFNFMEFTSSGNTIHSLRLPPETIKELEESFILCYTGNTHDSGLIHEDQKKQTQNHAHIRELIEANKELTLQMKSHLLRGKLSEFGRALHQTWLLKKQFSGKISNPWLDEVYQLAIDNGALGGKVLGAGGGGYFLFFARPFERFKVMTVLREKGLQTQTFNFDADGLQTWKSRLQQGE